MIETSQTPIRLAYQKQTTDPSLPHFKTLINVKIQIISFQYTRKRHWLIETLNQPFINCIFFDFAVSRAISCCVSRSSSSSSSLSFSLLHVCTRRRLLLVSVKSSRCESQCVCVRYYVAHPQKCCCLTRCLVVALFFNCSTFNNHIQRKNNKLELRIIPKLI